MPYTQTWRRKKGHQVHAELQETQVMHIAWKSTSHGAWAGTSRQRLSIWERRRGKAVRLSAGKAERERVLFSHPDVEEDVVGDCSDSAGVAVEDEEKGASHDVSPVSLFQ